MENINDFTIHRFRGLRDLKLEGLGQVNLFVGNNNSGKTSALEAFSIYSNPFSWRRWNDIGAQREFLPTRSTRIDRLIWLFPQADDKNGNIPSENAEISLAASGHFALENLTASYEKFSEIVKVPRSISKPDESIFEEIVEERDSEVEGIRISISLLERMVQLKLFGSEPHAFKEILTFSDSVSFIESKQPISTLPTQIVNPFSHRTSSLTSSLWSDVVEANLKSETIKLLRYFDPAIQDVDIISPNERKQQISIKHEKLGRAPLPTFGDGLRRVFTLASAIPRVRGGLLLVDELETAIHTKALEKTFDWLINACVKHNVQLIATTHSLEALDAVLEASRKSIDLVIYRLQQDKKKTTVTRFDKEMTLRLREELGMELRY